MLLSSLTAELFFVLSLVGVALELTAPFDLTPAWRRRPRWVVVAGLAVFGYVVVRWVLAILPPGPF